MIFPRADRPGMGLWEAPPPLGILYIASVLEERGHKVRVFDSTLSEIIDEVRKFRPEVIGISATTPQIPLVKELVKHLREEMPPAFFVCGGVHVTALPEFSIKDLNIDCVVVGEGEYSMADLCERLEDGGDLKDVKGIVYRDEDGKIVRNEGKPLIKDLDEVPFPAWHLLDLEKYFAPPGPIRGLWLERCTHMICSRGCPYQCIFCASHLVFGRMVRRRSVSNVIEEIMFLMDKYKIDGIWFMDDTFTTSKKWVMDFSRGLRENKIDLKWCCQARVDTITEEMLMEMKKSGCEQLDFGVESGSERVLKALKKGISPQMVRDAFKLTKRLGLRALATFMIGNPNETKEDINTTFKLAKEIDPDYVNFYFITPYPGTELHDMAIKNKWIKSMDYFDYLVRYEPVMEINFTREELIKMRARLQNAFILHNFGVYLKSPKYLSKIMLLLLRYPVGLIKGIQASSKQRTLDDLAHAFLRHYWEKRAKIRDARNDL